MSSPSSIVLLLLAISSTWSAFFWQPRAEFAVILAWAVTVLFLLQPSPKSRPLEQFLLYTPSLVPLALFAQRGEFFSGWSLGFSTAMTLSCLLFLTGHLVFHWNTLMQPVKQTTSTRGLIRLWFACSHAVHLLAFVVWLSVYFSMFHLELENQFNNSNTLIVWHVNLLFVCFIASFAVFAIAPPLRGSKSFTAMQIASFSVALLFLVAYISTALGLSSTTGISSVFTKPQTLDYLALAPTFFAVSMLAQACHRVSGLRPPFSNNTFRTLNELD